MASLWKFKAMGRDVAGKVIPGGGLLAERYDTAFAAPDAVEVSAQLGLG